MKILFITLSDMRDINVSGIYTDLVRNFIQHGHEMYVISPAERRTKGKTGMIESHKCKILKVRTGNIQKTNFIEKGISTVLLEKQLIFAAKKHLSDIKFDLVLYSTPPVTISGVVKYLKKRDNATTYLMLKDIFPQNAIDLGILKKNSMVHKYFVHKEKKLYSLSDYIGCTSPENIRFIRRNHPEMKNKLEICVNCMEPFGDFSARKLDEIRNKYKLPSDKRIFLYGGNLGKPQGVDFLMKCLKNTSDIKDILFLIVGAGTEKTKLENFIRNEHLENVKIFDYIPKAEFEMLTAACDIGLIFLNYKNTTPNTPSRLLSYLNASIPVLSVTDPSTDIGEIIDDGNFGWHCLSNDVKAYRKVIEEILLIENMEELKKNAHLYLLNHYTPDEAYRSIMQHFAE